MRIEGHAPLGLRKALALFILLAAIAFFGTAALAAAPAKAPGKVQPAGGGTPSPTPTGCIRVWNVVDSPNPYSSDDLYGVDAISSADVWAVGAGQAQHWDGSAWAVMTGTLPITPTTELRSVSASSSSDVWAVGRGPEAGHFTGVILHWDGSNWSNVPNPDAQEDTGLFGVAAISPNDAWAVGYRGDFNRSNALALHWDGSSWSVVSTPAPPSGTYYFLTAVSAISTNDVWAVGYTNSGALMMHWDGTAWSVSPASISALLYGVVALSDNDVWASGRYWDGSTWSGAIVHWDGTSWSLSTSGNGTALFGMAATSPSDVWAVGYSSNGTLIMRWDGSTWAPVDSPRPFPYAGHLWGVSPLSPTEVWAAGYASSGPQDTTLTIRYTQWCPTPVQCSTGWNVIDVANPSPDVNEIFGIDGDSANDIWAVGAFDMANGGTYAQHWNGSYWLPVPIPVVPAVTVLRSVKVLSANDVWAVGWDDESVHSHRDFGALLGGRNRQALESPSYYYRTVTVHWDGQSWTRVPSPNPGITIDGNELYGVDGVSANDLWAVGTYSDNNGFETLILHWDGSTWSQVTSPLGDLHSVEALSSDNVWAVGDSGPYSGSTTLILHWNGSGWSSVPSPSPGTETNALYSISAVSADDIWAVGGYDSVDGHHALSLHWDGMQWSAVDAPGSADLEGVSASSADDVWAAGDGNSSAQATILHWDGSAWTIVPHPDPNPNQPSELDSVLAVSANEVWTVGTAGQYSRHALIERYVASCATSSPTATQTPIQTLSPTPSPVPTGCTPGWSIVPSPPDNQSSFLVDLAMLSNTDGWAVGSQGSGLLIEHWNGQDWTISASPPGLTATALYSVSAVSPDDIWTVGYVVIGSTGARAKPFGETRAPDVPDSTIQTVAYHWDGQTWTGIPSPDPGGSNQTNILYAVSAVSSNDAWAVGYYHDTNGATQSLTAHWDGSSWTVVPAPPGILYGVDSISHDDVWAVGQHAQCCAQMILHWDGSAWTEITTSQPGASLYGISAVSSTDIWAVGNIHGSTESYVLHWDGTTWSGVPANYTDELIGVTAISHNDVWAVGTDSNHVETLHWDGTSWTNIPDAAGAGSDLYHVAAVPDGHVWAVGERHVNMTDLRTLIERYTSSCLTSTPTPTSTATIPATGTPTPISTTSTAVATATATTTAIATTTPIPSTTAITTASATAGTVASSTPTPTACTLQFEDVPQGNTFYAGVHCLACLGIVNGYPDGTFRPNANVTRGQLAKIVSNSAGFDDTVTGQTFEDVPPGSTFYTYIERLDAHGVMSGYPCGGPGEPCGSQHRPYFRPNNMATRGQLTKIVSNAAGFNNPIPPDTQTFTDVPAGSSFYVYVERLLFNRPGVMSGYPCGGPGEQCDPEHRPYFRPNNTLTRGQTAKITANTFFPSCSP